MIDSTALMVLFVVGLSRHTMALGWVWVMQCGSLDHLNAADLSFDRARRSGQMEGGLDGDLAVEIRCTVVDPYLQVFLNWGRGPRLGFDMPGEFPSWSRHAKRLASREAVARVLEREGIALP
ncbi:hypothetical protein EAH89_18895 [Roseomonas nepalensis]|uniref:Uncharacterized protein n=1 Tax=Muricoccus nepalensis TaxID=1854500 RepID=A0A502FSS8_9PROT|nr:hypothetical protein [Roseomonas nepalensis]TPG52302.1 hypothetical protein EAH89_18895 [Roseomonas nepalensis]